VIEDRGAILFATVAAIAVSSYFFLRAWKYWRLIKDTPTSRLRSAHQGFVEIEGKGIFSQDHAIYAPLSNHSCIWYQSVIECKSSFKSRHTWRVIYQNTSESSFLLDDGTGICLVDPRGAEIISNEKLVWYGDTEWPVRTGIMDSAPFAMSLKSEYRYTESLVLPGQRLYVLGQLSTHSPATHCSLRDVMRDLLDSWKLDSKQLLLRFDSNHDGEIDLSEWEEARRTARSEAEVLHQMQQVEPTTNHVFRPEDKRQPYIISVQPQITIVNDFRRNAIVMLICCLGSFGYFIWQLYAYWQ